MFELVGGLVAEEFHAVAAFDERDALGHQALQLHRADFRAILFLLATLLGVLVVVQGALHAVGGTVEEVDRGPEQVFEVGFQACVTQRGDQGVKDVGDGATDDLGFGERPGVGLVLEGAMAVELEFGEEVVGGG